MAAPLHISADCTLVEDEQLDAAEHAQQPSIAAVATGEREIGEQLWHTLVEHRSVITAGLGAERTSEPALADAGRAADHQVVMLVDEVALGELEEEGAV